MVGEVMMLRVRQMSPREREAIRRLLHSPTAAAHLVQRARIVWMSSQGERASAIATSLGVRRNVVYRWLNRFNVEGPAGIEDRR